jgi:hypothetical protein
MHTLDRVNGQAGEVEGVLLGGVETCLRTSAAVVVLADEHGVGQQGGRTGRRLRRKRHVSMEVTLVVAVEVDLERATDMRFVVRMVVEGRAVDLDRAVVACRVGGPHGGW